MKWKLEIEPSNVVMTGANTAGIKNSKLATYLVRETADAVSDLSNLYGNITSNDITISSDGTVVIDTVDFKKFAKDTINNPVAPVAGWGCANAGCI